jgi:hypothetical protein
MEAYPWVKLKDKEVGPVGMLLMILLGPGRECPQGFERYAWKDHNTYLYYRKTPALTNYSGTRGWDSKPVWWESVHKMLKELRNGSTPGSSSSGYDRQALAGP